MYADTDIMMNNITASTNSCRYGKFNHRHTMCVITAPANPHPGAIHISPRGQGTLGDSLESAPALIGTPVCMHHKMPMPAGSARDHIYDACFDYGCRAKPQLQHATKQQLATLVSFLCNKTATRNTRIVPAKHSQPSISIATRASSRRTPSRSNQLF